MLNDQIPEYWCEIAKHDADTAHLLIRENGYADIIIYHFHQAIEKYLKGKIIESKGTFPFIHDLKRLYRILVDRNACYEGLDNAVITLSQFHKDLRYPQSEILKDDDVSVAEKAFDEIMRGLNLSPPSL